MKIYIAGQITGLDYDEAFKNFEDAEYHLGLAGHEGVNPMKSEGEVPGKRWAEYMSEDILILEDCDGIFMLPNWRNSKGARLEHEMAVLMEKRIFYGATQL